ncbi:MAG: hypothetical protein KDI63_13005 [Gammaproteobacteria bacterium]|nr:hypothetical protein [Gammaproteobacteria bacterium]
MKSILAIILTFLITGPIGIVVGYKMAEKQVFQQGEHQGRSAALLQLRRDVDERLGYRLAQRQEAGKTSPEIRSIGVLYPIAGGSVYLVEIAGIKTLAIAE